MKTIESEFNAALTRVNPEWSVEMGPYSGNYTIILGNDEDGDPVESACPEEIIKENFDRILCMDRGEGISAWHSSTYRISDYLTVTIDDNDNFFELTEEYKSDEEIRQELLEAQEYNS